MKDNCAPSLPVFNCPLANISAVFPLFLEQISIKGNTMAVGKNVGAGLAPAQ
jgi:hypothetical protein